MKKTVFQLLTLVTIILFSAQAFASYNGVEISPPNKSVVMQRNDNVGLAYTFINTSNEKKCMNIITITNSPYLEASISDSSFCLNAGERTELAVSLKTIDAPNSTFYAGIVLTSGNSSYDISIAKVIVGDSDSIEIIPYPTDICRGKEGYVNVLVRNNTPFFQTVKLNAENEVLLPSFAQSEIYLDAFGEKNVKLFVHTNRLTSLGTKEVSIYATTFSDYIKKTVQINVKDCEGITAPNFSVDFSTGCTEIEKTKSSTFYFTVKNLSNEAQTLNIAVLSDLPNYLGNNSIGLDAFEERTLHFDVNARVEDKTGDHNASLIVWNENQRIEKSKCIRVKATSIARVELLNDSITIRQCNSDSFVFIARNIGDTNMDFNFRAANIPEGISISFSDKNFRLSSHSEKEVYAFVSVAEDAEIKGYDLNFVIKAEGKTFYKKAKVSVIEKAQEVAEEELAIESYPLQVTAKQDSTEEITIKLRNNSGAVMTGIEVRVKNLASGIKATSVRNIELNPSQSKEIKLLLTIEKAEPGRHKALLEITKGTSVSTREIEIVIGETAAADEKETQKNLFAGLFTTGENIALGLVVLIIVLLMAIAFIGLSVSRQETAIEKVGVKR